MIKALHKTPKVNVQVEDSHTDWFEIRIKARC